MTTQAPEKPEAETAFPWSLLYSERMSLATDLARLDREIQHHRWEAEQLQPVRDALAKRLADITEATTRYEQNTRSHRP